MIRVDDLLDLGHQQNLLQGPGAGRQSLGVRLRIDAPARRRIDPHQLLGLLRDAVHDGRSYRLEDPISHRAADHSHVENVRTERRYAAVRKQQALHEISPMPAPPLPHPGRPTPQSAPRQSNGPMYRGDGKVQHLRREHERGREAQQGNLSPRKLLTHLVDAVPNPPAASAPVGCDCLSVQKSVRNVHVFVHYFTVYDSQAKCISLFCRRFGGEIAVLFSEGVRFKTTHLEPP